MTLDTEEAEAFGDRKNSVDMANSRIFAHKLRSPASVADVNRLNSQFKAHIEKLTDQTKRKPRNFKRSHVSFGFESSNKELHTIWDYIQD